MPMMLCQNLLQMGRLRRGVAVFLLAFVFFDISIVDVFFPQLCGDEQSSVSVINRVGSAEKIAHERLSIQKDNSQPNQDLSQSSIDEDCFCCCSHIIPGVSVNVAVLNDALQPYDPMGTSLPSSPPQGAFHPPRHF